MNGTRQITKGERLADRTALVIGRITKDPFMSKRSCPEDRTVGMIWGKRADTLVSPSCNKFEMIGRGLRFKLNLCLQFGV